MTVVKVLSYDRVLVERPNADGSGLDRKEVHPTTLEVHWDIGKEVDEDCPICLETFVVGKKYTYTCVSADIPSPRHLFTANNPSSLSFVPRHSQCGGEICTTCFAKTLRTAHRDICMLCRADTSDDSDEAHVARVTARAARGDGRALHFLGVFCESLKAAELCVFSFAHPLSKKDDNGMRGLRKNKVLATEYYKKAALAGSVQGAYNLGVMLRDAEGVPRDLAGASKYFRMAAEKGDTKACTNYGIALMRGDGVATDLEEAKKWLRKAEKDGDELAVQELEKLDMIQRMRSLGVDAGFRFNPLM